MSVRDALAFIRAVHEDPALAARVDALGVDATIDQVVAIATDAGFAFGADDLRAAHRHDWGLRQVRFRDA